jgi:hypothetical protein
MGFLIWSRAGMKNGTNTTTTSTATWGSTLIQQPMLRATSVEHKENLKQATMKFFLPMELLYRAMP